MVGGLRPILSACDPRGELGGRGRTLYHGGESWVFQAVFIAEGGVDVELRRTAGRRRVTLTLGLGSRWGSVFFYGPESTTVSRTKGNDGIRD